MSSRVAPGRPPRTRSTAAVLSGGPDDAVLPDHAAGRLPCACTARVSRACGSMTGKKFTGSADDSASANDVRFDLSEPLLNGCDAAHTRVKVEDALVKDRAHRYHVAEEAHLGPRERRSEFHEESSSRLRT